MPLKAPPVPYAASYNWTGFYVGGEVGGGWASSQTTIVSDIPAAAPFPVGWVNPIKYTGVLGGVYAGYNYQIDQFAVGIDGDYTWADLTGTGFFVAPVGINNISQQSKTIDWISTVTGRLGYANNNWLFFAKGGWAGAGFSGNSVQSGAGILQNTATFLYNVNGWTVGGGVEYGFAAHASLKLEYDYVQFDTANVNVTQITAATGAVGYPARSVTSYLNMLKGGIAYRF